MHERFDLQEAHVGACAQAWGPGAGARMEERATSRTGEGRWWHTMARQFYGGHAIHLRRRVKSGPVQFSGRIPPALNHPAALLQKEVRLGEPLAQALKCARHGRSGVGPLSYGTQRVSGPSVDPNQISVALLFAMLLSDNKGSMQGMSPWRQSLTTCSSVSARQ